jgi:ABC-2 type transport system ATP-binding protein
VRIRLLAPPDDAEQKLTRAPLVAGVSRDPDGAFRVEFRGGDEALADIIDYAVNERLRVVRIEPDQNDLERIFLEVTKGEVQ